MTARLRVICEPDLAAGFGLAGISALASEPQAAEASLADLLRRRDAGVVLLQEQLHESLSPDVRARLDRSATPVVVPFPGPAWVAPASAEERVVELLRRAIGYRVKLR